MGGDLNFEQIFLVFMFSVCGFSLKQSVSSTGIAGVYKV
jgi:hypothetical protein